MIRVVLFTIQDLWSDLRVAGKCVMGEGKLSQSCSPAAEGPGAQPGALYCHEPGMLNFLLYSLLKVYLMCMSVLPACVVCATYVPGAHGQ